MKELMSVKEAARYLGLNEKKVYQLAKEGALPVARIGGKWVFPKHLLDDWIERDALSRLRFRSSMEPLVIMGSNDPAWEIVAKKLGAPPYNIVVSFSSIGSTRGFLALSQGFCDAACSHLIDPETSEYNIPYLPKYLKGEDVLVVSLFNREQGLIVKKGNPKGIKSVGDLARRDVIFINRQEGSGTRVLLDMELSRLGVDPDTIKGYHKVANTHLEVAISVLRGEADVGIGVKAASRMVDLDFVPLKSERYDLIIPKSCRNLKRMRILLEVLRSDDLRKLLERLGGYETFTTGRIVWEGRV